MVRAMRMHARFVVVLGLAVLASCGGGKAAGPRATPVVPAGPTVEVPTIPVTAPLVPPPSVNGRLPTDIVPQAYGLTLTVDPEKPRFSGTTYIDILATAPTRAIILHARKMNITSAVVGTPEGAIIPAKATLRMASGGKEDPEELVLELSSELRPGEARIAIEYDAPFDDQLRGLYRVKDGERWYAFTQFEPTDARRAFPCFDEPGFKVPFTLQLRHPDGLMALANSEPVPVAVAPVKGVATTEFATTPPLPTYLVAFAVGPFELLEGPADARPRIRVATPIGKSKLGAVALESSAAFVKIMEDYFAQPYPFSKLDLLAVPEFAAGAMENPGLITFRDEALLLAPQASTSARRRVAGIVAHELAHQWFGNLVTMKWWNDLWLNEGFATWMADKVVDVWQPSFGARVESLSSKAWVMETDALASARAVRQPINSTSEALEAFDGITYVKGASILTMLESHVGEDAFRAGVRAYLAAHARGSATADDLFAELDRAAPDKPVSKLAATFLDRAGLPLVRASAITCDGAAGASVQLTQRRYVRAGAQAGAGSSGAGAGIDASAPWSIPVCLMYSAAKGAPKTTCTMLDGPSATVPLPGAACKQGWVYPNASEAGYYRWVVPDAMFTQLAAAAGKGQLAVAQRLGLINDAWALVGSGDLGADVMLVTLARFGGERERNVVDALDSARRTVRDTVVAPADEAAYAAWVVKLLGPMGKQLGWDAGKTDSEDRRLTRQTVLRLLGDLGNDKATLAEAARRLKLWLDKPEALDPDMAAMAVSLGARTGTRETFDALLAIHKAAKLPEHRVLALTGLGNFSDPALLGEALALALSADVRLQDMRYIVRPAVRHATRAITWAWLQKNWDAIKARVGGFGIDRFVGITGAFCDRAERDAAEAFFTPRIANLEGTARTLKESLEEADVCINLRAREAAKVRAFLKK